MPVKDFRYRMDKTRLCVGTLGVTGFLAIGVSLMLHEGPRSNALLNVLIFLTVVVPSSAFLFIGLSALFVFGPAVEITESTISWNVSWMCKGELAWPQIKSVSCVCISGVWFVNLEPYDMDAFVAKQPLVRRILYRTMIRYKWPVLPTNVPGTGLRDGSAGVIARRVRSRMRTASNNSFKPTPLCGSA